MSRHYYLDLTTTSHHGRLLSSESGGIIVSHHAMPFNYSSLAKMCLALEPDPWRDRREKTILRCGDPRASRRHVHVYPPTWLFSAPSLRPAYAKRHKLSPPADPTVSPSRSGGRMAFSVAQTNDITLSARSRHALVLACAKLHCAGLRSFNPAPEHSVRTAKFGTS